MERIRELLRLLANAAGMPHDELVAARNELGLAAREWAASDESVSDEGSAISAELLATLDTTATIISEREETIAERRRVLTEGLDAVAPLAEEAEVEVEVEAPAAEVDTPAAEVEVIDVVEPEPELVNATAGRRVPLSVISRRQPAATQPLPAEPAGPSVMAAPDLRNFSARQELTERQAAEAMLERLESARMADEHTPPSIMRAGRIDWSAQYPEDRRIVKGSADTNDRRIAAVVGEYPGDPRAIQPAQRDGDGLVASGGLCAPVTVRYELETVSTATRPLRAGLPSFNADRGGIQFNGPAHLVDILADTTSAALTTVTVANDAAGVTKTVQEVACGALTTVQVRAIAERLQFSNFADRYNPERMKQFMTLARAAHSRLAERQLFEDMRAASTLVSGGPLWVGALRQWFNNVLVAAAAMRYRHRMDDAYPLRCVYPDWFETLIALDLGLQSNGEQTVLRNWEADAVIRKWLAVENIMPIVQVDDARTANALGADAPAFGSQTGNGANLNDFPGVMTTLLFPEGSFLFLDGGSLDFGIVRDSTLNAANRFQTFYETFEGVAMVGVESLAIVSHICASGQGIAGTTTTKCGGIGS